MLQAIYDLSIVRLFSFPNDSNSLFSDIEDGSAFKDIVDANKSVLHNATVLGDMSQVTFGCFGLEFCVTGKYTNAKISCS